jgi:hypothetical protein
MDQTNTNNNFRHKYSILLYLVSEGHSKGIITESEKIKIKQLIVNQNSQIFAYLTSYEKDGKVDLFLSKLKNLVNSQNNGLQKQSLTKIQTNLPTVEHLSSPTGSELIKKKKRNMTKIVDNTNTNNTNNNNLENNNNNNNEDNIEENLNLDEHENDDNNDSFEHSSSNLRISECQQGISPPTELRKCYNFNNF